MRNQSQNYRVAIMTNASTTPVMVENVTAYGFVEAMECLRDKLQSFEEVRGIYLKKLTVDIELFDNSQLEEFGKPRKPRKK